MRTFRSSVSLLLASSLITASLVPACGSDDSSPGIQDGTPGGSSGSSSGSAGSTAGGASGGSAAGGKAGSSPGGFAGSSAGGAAATSGTSGQSGSAGATTAGAAGSSTGGQSAGGTNAGGSSGGGNSVGGTSAGGSSVGGSSAGGANAGGTSGDQGGAGPGGSGTSTGGSAGVVQGFDVQPAALQTITVPINAKTPTVDYAATLDGQPVSAAWSVDKGNIGTVKAGPAATTTFAPTGTTGGLVNVLAGYNSATLSRQVLVKLSGSQNGADPTNPLEAGQIPSVVGDLTKGGGLGGVGGEGLGGAVTDPGLQGLLSSPSGDGKDQNLRFLYPYDRTVWPRGMLAPLLMWDWATGDADAIKITLATTSGSFSWTGTFARPAILQQTGGKFIRHPIPQDIWEMATNTAGGPTPDNTPDRLTVSLVIARGNVSYGPLTETWSVAPGRLGGIIYYNSYGTRLARNFTGAVGGDGKFGGAVLSIHAGDTGPKLTAGTDANESGCRVCHSVAARGSRLIVQRGDSYATSSDYELTTNGSTEKAMATGATFPAIAPDGSIALSPTGQVLQLPAGSVVPSSGLTSVSTSLGSPAFSPDGKRVVFNPMNGSLANPTQKLVVMDFDPATRTFANPLVVSDYTGKPAPTRPGWPAFFPDGNSVVFQQQVAAGSDGNGDGALYTRKGAKGQIVWASASNASGLTPLNALNGLDESNNPYLPKLAAPSALTCTADGQSVGAINADHGDDVNLNYEPTVNPVASGGYAWVVFTSRRLYGNEATIPPFCSDPRGVNLVNNITTKKLWVSAIDLNAQPGQDSSHPAFYLPAQELLAGNARGFWVLDPCRQDGNSCQSGDQCCGGFCQPNGQDGALVCSNTPPNNQCSKTQEKCANQADCCDPTNICVGGFCSQSKP